jgi:predicted methyltransferase
MTKSSRSMIAAAFAAALLSSTACYAAAQQVPAELAAAVADPARPEADKARDANRKPAETVAFAGVKPGMIVAELGPSAGYYTKILAKAVGPKGKVYALVAPANAARPNGMDAINAVAAANPNVTVLVGDFAAIKLPEKADLFWTTENFHDYHNGPTANVPGLTKAAFENLKPGGIFYVEDHSAAPGAGVAAASTVHRMDEAIAKKELTDAGFKIDAEGTILKNPSDDRTKRMNEAGNFLTDRFMLRLKRP